MPFSAKKPPAGTRKVRNDPKAGMNNHKGIVMMWTVIAVMMLGGVQAWPQSPFPADTTVRRSRDYDVVHYRLEVAIDESRKMVRGSNTITLTPLRERLDSVVLDAVDLTVDSVHAGIRTSARFANTAKRLTVYLDPPRTLRETLIVSVWYSCTPTLGLYFVQPDSSERSKHRQIWTQGEDMDNRGWFPCYDYPNDKATSEVIATVPENYVLVSNGVFVRGTHDVRGKTRTFHWQQSIPHSSYLIMLAAGEYEVLRDRYRSIPLEYYVYKEHVADARRIFSKTPAMMKFFEETIGIPYPWEKYAQIIIDDFMWGGMENTSATTLNATTVMDTRAELDFTSDDLLSHELAHQWWGDLVTFRDWSNMWLSEGFANYYESLFREHDKGKDELQFELLQAGKTAMRAEQSLGRRPIVSPGSYTENVYAKGGWVLHMLRSLLGDRTFAEAMNYYVRRHRFGNADTHELQLAIEDATGQNLDWFFKQWVFGAGYPELSVTRHWDEARKILTISVKQTQQRDSLCGLFRFPLTIECSSLKEKKTVSGWVSGEEQTWEVMMDEEPKMVIVDKGQTVLKSVEMEKSEDELIHQLLWADEVVDRTEAARRIRTFKERGAAFQALSHSAVRDPFWGVRREATVSLGVMVADGVMDTLLAVCGDRDSRVRHAAVVAMERFHTPEVARFLEAMAARESSYVVLGACVGAVGVVDSTQGFAMAERYIGVESYRDIVRRACLGSMRRLKDPRGVSYAIRYAKSGSAKDIRVQSIGLLGDFGAADSSAKLTLFRLVNDPEADVRLAAVRALKTVEGDDVRSLLEGRRQIEHAKNILEEIEEVLRSSEP